ncbi:hypothetical protein C8R46DRAFT_1124131 [Mycena filopes]|nr:hypothetical protein C8R46DRAFT_1124131 [Mycena filopes]
MRARARENADEDDEEEEDGEDTRRGEGGDAGEEDEAEEGWADDLDFRAEVADMKVPLSPASAAARVERLRGVFDEDDDVDVVEGSSEGSFLGGLGESVGAAAAAAGAGEAREDEEGRGQEVEVEVDGVDALRDGDEVIPATSDSGADEAALAARLDILAEQLVTLQSRLAGMQAVSAGDERGEGRVAELDGRVRALEETVDAPSPIPAITLPTLPPPASTPPPAVPADVEELKSSLLSSFASLKTEWATFRTEAEAFSSPAYPYAPRADDSDSDSDSGDAKNTRIGRGPTWREDPDDARVPGRWGLLTPAGSVRALSPHRNGAASALGAGPRWPLGALLGGDGYGTGSAFGEHWNATTPVQALAAANGVAHQEDDEHDGSPKDHMSPPLGDPTRKEGASKTKTRTDPFLIVGALGAGAAIVAAAWWGA